MVQEFIKSNELKTVGDIQEVIKDLFKDTLQEMLNAESTEHLGYEKTSIQTILRIIEMNIHKKQYILLKVI